MAYTWNKPIYTARAPVPAFWLKLSRMISASAISSGLAVLIVSTYPPFANDAVQLMLGRTRGGPGGSVFRRQWGRGAHRFLFATWSFELASFGLIVGHPDRRLWDSKVGRRMVDVFPPRMGRVATILGLLDLIVMTILFKTHRHLAEFRHFSTCEFCGQVAKLFGKR